MAYAVTGLVFNGLIVISSVGLIRSSFSDSFNASLEVSRIANQCPVQIDANSYMTNVKLSEEKGVVVDYTLRNHSASNIDLEKWEEFTSPRIKKGIEKTVFQQFLEHGYEVRYRYLGKNGRIIIEYQFNPTSP